MVKLIRKTHTLLYYAFVLLFFIPCFPFLYYFTRYPDRYYKQIVLLRKWISTSATQLAGIRFKITFEEEIDWTKPYVICPNHTSILDITAITYLCPQPFSFMGKIELLKNPVTRMFFKSIDIAVDRKSKISSFRAFKRADALIKEGKSVVIFPEGKIDDEYPPRLHEFKSGSFRIAVDNQIQILPVVIHDAWELLFDSGTQFGSKPGVIHMTVLKPIQTGGLADAAKNDLQALVYKNMLDSYHNYSITKNNI